MDTSVQLNVFANVSRRSQSHPEEINREHNGSPGRARRSDTAVTVTIDNSYARGYSPSRNASRTLVVLVADPTKREGMQKRKKWKNRNPTVYPIRFGFLQNRDFFSDSDRTGLSRPSAGMEELSDHRERPKKKKKETNLLYHTKRNVLIINDEDNNIRVADESIKNNKTQVCPERRGREIGISLPKNIRDKCQSYTLYRVLD